MKKLLIIISTVFVLFALAACGGNSDNSTAENTTMPTVTPQQPLQTLESTTPPANVAQGDSETAQDSAVPVFELTAFDPFNTQNFYFNLFGTKISLHDRLGDFYDLSFSLSGNMGSSLNMNENQLGESSTGIFDRSILINRNVIRGTSGPVTISNSVGTMFFTHDPNSHEPVSEATIIGISFRYNEGGNYDWFSGPGGLHFGLTREEVVYLIGEPTGGHTNLGREYSTWSEADGIVLTLSFDNDERLVNIAWANRNISN